MKVPAIPKHIARKAKSHEKRHLQILSLFAGLGVVALIAYMNFYADTNDLIPRRFLDDDECAESETLLTWVDIDTGDLPFLWITLYIIGMVWMFTAMAIVCDEYFVPALEVMAEELGISEDVAGATLMAAGGSAPELFTSLIGAFQESDVGFGTIVGSAVFNVLFVIGMCAIYSKTVLKLTWWPLFRDCVYYTLGLCVLAAFFKGSTPDEMTWWECVILFGGYLGYVFMMSRNVALHDWFVGLIGYDDKVKIIPVNFHNPQTFRAGILHLLIGEKSMFDTISYRVITDIRGDVEKTFAAFDENGDGSIQIKELKEMLRRMGCPMDDADAEKTFGQLDTDANGNVDFDEFTKWYTKSEARVEKEMKTLFDKYDEEKNGLITDASLRRLLADAGLDEAEVDKAEHELAMKEDEAATLTRQGTSIKSIMMESREDGYQRKAAHEGVWFLESGLTAEVREDSVVWHDGTSSQITFDGPKNSTNRWVILNLEDEMCFGVMGKRGEILTIQWFDGEIWQRRESDALTFPMFREWYKQQMFYHDKMSAYEEEGEHAATLADLLEYPMDADMSGQFWYLFSLPFALSFWLTIPDCRGYKRATFKWAVCGFLMSIAWIGGISVCLVDWATMLGDYAGIPIVVMGFTVLAAGTSIPDLLSSVIVAQRGFGDMAVSSSIGSNIFDILFGLPVPWMLYCLIKGKNEVKVTAESLFLSLCVLIAMLVAVVGTIILSDWKMTQKLGYAMFGLYVIFMIQGLATADFSC